MLTEQLALPMQSDIDCDAHVKVRSPGVVVTLADGGTGVPTAAGAIEAPPAGGI